MEQSDVVNSLKVSSEHPDFMAVQERQLPGWQLSATSSIPPHKNLRQPWSRQREVETTCTTS